MNDLYDLTTHVVRVLLALGCGGLLAIAWPIVLPASRRGEPALRRRVATLTGGLAAAAVLAHDVVPSSVRVAACAPYAIVAAASAVAGLRRLLAMPSRPIEELVGALALAYLAGGAVWLVVAVSGEALLGFGGLQATLTAVHFHYAGFGACALAGDLVRARPGRIERAAAVGMALGVPALAIGIATTRTIEIAAAALVVAALLLLGIALATRAPRVGGVRGVAFGIAGGATLLSSPLALLFATRGFASLGPSVLTTMTFAHGVTNALLVVGLGLVAAASAPSPRRVPPSGAPFSRLRAGAFVGPGFFERARAVDAARRATGLADDLSAYDGEGLVVASLPEPLRAFYERTDEFSIVVRPTWQRGWVVAGGIWHRIAAAIGQLVLPWQQRPGLERVKSRIVALDGARDGRDAPRGWVRSYVDDEGRERGAIYVAAYSSAVHAGRRTMNIAFPLPLSNMTSVLRMDPIAGRGISLSTAPQRELGDQGVFLVTPVVTVRLPLDERIDVWGTAGDPTWRERVTTPEEIDIDAVEVIAIHDMYAFGRFYLRLEYWIGRGELRRSTAP